MYSARYSRHRRQRGYAGMAVSGPGTHARVGVADPFVSRLLGLAFVYLAVKGPGDAALAALGVSLGNVLLAICALWILHRNRLVKLVGISTRKIVDALKDGFPLFLSFVLISFYVNFNSILLNYFHGPGSGRSVRDGGQDSRGRAGHVSW